MTGSVDAFYSFRVYN